jgi:hypothetical protein
MIGREISRAVISGEVEVDAITVGRGPKSDMRRAEITLVKLTGTIFHFMPSFSH